MLRGKRQHAALPNRVEQPATLKIQSDDLRHLFHTGKFPTWQEWNDGDSSLSVETSIDNDISVPAL